MKGGEGGAKRKEGGGVEREREKDEKDKRDKEGSLFWRKGDRDLSSSLVPCCVLFFQREKVHWIHPGPALCELERAFGG